MLRQPLVFCFAQLFALANAIEFSAAARSRLGLRMRAFFFITSRRTLVQSSSSISVTMSRLISYSIAALSNFLMFSAFYSLEQL